MHASRHERSGRGGTWTGVRPRFDLGPAAAHRPRFQGNAVGHSRQPAAEGCGQADSAGVAHQDEERGLERVFDISRFAQNLTAGAQHSRAMPADDGLEGNGIAGLAVGGQQVGIGLIRPVVRFQGLPEGLDQPVQGGTRHRGLLAEFSRMYPAARASAPGF